MMVVGEMDDAVAFASAGEAPIVIEAIDSASASNLFMLFSPFQKK